MRRRCPHPRQLLAGVRFYKRNKPGQVVEHSRPHIDEVVDTEWLGKDPTLAMWTEKMPVFAM